MMAPLVRARPETQLLPWAVGLGLFLGLAHAWLLRIVVDLLRDVERTSATEQGASLELLTFGTAAMTLGVLGLLFSPKAGPCRSACEQSLPVAAGALWRAGLVASWLVTLAGPVTGLAVFTILGPRMPVPNPTGLALTFFSALFVFATAAATLQPARGRPTITPLLAVFLGGAGLVYAAAVGHAGWLGPLTGLAALGVGLTAWKRAERPGLHTVCPQRTGAFGASLGTSREKALPLEDLFVELVGRDA